MHRIDPVAGSLGPRHLTKLIPTFLEMRGLLSRKLLKDIAETSMSRKSSLVGATVGIKACICKSGLLLGRRSLFLDQPQLAHTANLRQIFGYP